MEKKTYSNSVYMAIVHGIENKMWNKKKYNSHRWDQRHTEKKQEEEEDKKWWWWALFYKQVRNSFDIWEWIK